MYPRLFTIPAFDLFSRHLGPFSLPTYGVLLATAFVAGLWIVNRQAKRAGLDAARLTDLAVWALLGGLVGAKLLLLAVEWRYYSQNLSELLSIFRSGVCSTAGCWGPCWWRSSTSAGTGSLVGLPPTCWPRPRSWVRPSAVKAVLLPAAAGAGPPPCPGR